MAQSQQNFVPIPEEGSQRVCMSYQLDMTQGINTINIAQDNRSMDVVRGFYMANESNRDITAVVFSTGQSFAIAAGSEVYFPLLSAVPCQITFSCALGINQNVVAIFLNYQLPQTLGA